MAERVYQTTAADLRKGWQYYRAWRRDFCDSKASPRRGSDLVYIATENEVDWLDEMTESDMPPLEERQNDKAEFMKAYLSVAALSQNKFARYTKKILSLQSRLSARKNLGVWFTQSDIDKFGFGMSPAWQGFGISLFCETIEQIDFADTSTILPYDRIMVRHPSEKWRKKDANTVVRCVKYDLACDAIPNEMELTIHNQYLCLELASPDLGHEMTPARLRASSDGKILSRFCK